jgi:DNA primase
MSDRIVDHIKNEVSGLTTLKKNVGTSSIFIQCPYHSDRTPSGGINIDPTKAVPLGWFACFGCGKSVPWNNLAETLGLKKLKGRGKRTPTSSDYLDPKKLEAEFFQDEDEGKLNEKAEFDLKQITFFDFPPDVPKWRGFDTKFLASLGAKYIFHEHLNEFMVWFPCMVNQEQVGYIKAYMDKQPGRISYINSPGEWSRRAGLLFFDPAIQMMRDQGHKTIALVEGPRDGLRCLRYGIPAMPILGTKTWCEDKRLLLESAGVENIVIFMDGDKAGYNATKKLAKTMKGFLNFKYMNMWKYEKDWDPGNCPRRFLDKVRYSLTSF